MTHSHHPHCWYVQAARSFIIWTKEQSRPCHCCFTNHLMFLNPTLNRGLFFFKEGDIKRKNLSRLQHTKCSGTREENAVLCSALWWYNGRRVQRCCLLHQLRERRVHERAWNTDATVQGCRSCSLAGPREALRFIVLYRDTDKRRPLTCLWGLIVLINAERDMAEEF